MKKVSNIKLLILISLAGMFNLNCNKEKADNQGSIIEGEITYNGNYSGENTTIYIRGYKTDINAVGNPDFYTSISSKGYFSLDLGTYTGDFYISAFMDVDNSGSTGGLTADSILNKGVYADPCGCYGDYTFSDASPTKIYVEGITSNINFEIEDCGVIKVGFSNTGSCTFGVIKELIPSEIFLHHKHFDVTDINQKFLLAVPAKNAWNCKVKFDNEATVQLYSEQVIVTKNNITEINF